jgi:protein-tyrosine phosphatase
MVCLGNICRSPMAEGILRDKLQKRGLTITVDSAGTGGWHAGENPDSRAIRTAKKFGVDISHLVARKFSKKDFDNFDFIYVMDHENLRDVLSLAKTQEDIDKVKLLLDTGENKSGRAVPDPWYGGEEGFVEVYKMLDEACDDVVKSVVEKISS